MADPDPSQPDPSQRGFGTTNAYSTPGDPSSSLTNGLPPGGPGFVGTTGGIGKTGGFMGIGNENVQQQLAASGYNPYTATPGPNVAGLYTTNQAPEQQFRTGQLGLMNALQTSAAGQGPSAAQATLQAGQDQNRASLMAAIASGRGAPGTAGGVLSAGADAGQQTADQAAILRAQEIQSAQSQLGGVTNQGAAGDLGEQKLRADQGANYASNQESQWQFLNSLNAGQQGVINNIIGNAVTGANSSQQALVPQAIGAGAAAVAAIAAAHGAVVDKPTLILAGEQGKREAVVPIDRSGRPDMSRATDPKLKWILQNHGYIPPEAAGSGMPTKLPSNPGSPASDDHGILGQIMGLRQDIRELMARR